MLLKAVRNDYPDWYAEYKISDLNMTFNGFKEETIKRLVHDIKQNGLIHPIVIRSPYLEFQTDPNPDVSLLSEDDRRKVFYIHIGNQRVTAAKELGFTHISVYHVKKGEDAQMITLQTQMREFL